MALRSRRGFAIAGVALVALLLGYLRDPPWLAEITSGLSAWETDDGGVRYRWTRGHASFFVPADAATVVLTMRSVKDSPADWPITAAIGVDGRQVESVRFEDERWRAVTIRLPRPGTRAVRRLDVVVDRVRSRQRGVQLQAVRVEPGR